MADRIWRNLLKRLRFNWAYLRNRLPWDSGIPAPELVDYVRGRAAGCALDLGCGTGTNMQFLALQGWQVDGVDFSPLAIRRAQRRLHNLLPAPNLIVGDVARLEMLPLRSPFDLALDIGCLHALGTESAARAYVHGLHMLLQPEAGYLLYAHAAQQEGAAFPGHGLSLVWVEKLFSEGFRLLDYRPGKEDRRASAWYWLQRNSG